MMKWEVQLFAYLREKHGEKISVNAQPTSGAVLEALMHRGVGGDYCRLAVNNEFVDKDHALSEADDLALIPPVSGG